MSLLQVEDLEVRYDQIAALKGISLQIVRAGEIVALVGANGAGKSTTLMTISGILRPSGGRIVFDGHELQHLAPEKIVELGVVQCPEGRGIFPQMSVEENLLMGFYSRRKQDSSSRSMGWVFELFPVLKERIRQQGITLSGGEQQMLAIGRALMANPKLLLLDEPSLGLAPLLVDKVFSVIQQIHEEGTTILLVEQNARAALALADRAYVLEVGNIAIEGTGQQLLHDERVQKAYLGALRARRA